MDKDRQQGETSTVRTHDRGEISGKPVGSAENEDEATSERAIREQDAAETVGRQEKQREP